MEPEFKQDCALYSPQSGLGYFLDKPRALLSFFPPWETKVRGGVLDLGAKLGSVDKLRPP